MLSNTQWEFVMYVEMFALTRSRLFFVLKNGFRWGSPSLVCNDFSNRPCTPTLAPYAARHGCNVLYVGTTILEGSWQKNTLSRLSLSDVRGGVDHGKQTTTFAWNLHVVVCRLGPDYHTLGFAYHVPNDQDRRWFPTRISLSHSAHWCKRSEYVLWDMKL